MGAPPALGSCHQYSFVDEVRDVPECRSLRGFGHPCPFGRSEFAFESVPKPIDHFDLPFIHRHFPMALPKFGFAQDSSDCFLRTRQSAAHGLQKPFKPGRYIGGPGRGPFQNFVIGFLPPKYFSRHAVKPPRETISNMSKVKEAIDALSNNNTKIPTVEEVARYVNLPFDKVEEIMNIELIKNMVSLDQNIYTTEGGETLMDRIQSDEESNFEETYANKKIIEFALNKLPPADKTAIYMYYIDGESRKDIAKKLNVSATQVSRILKRALNKLYNIIQKELGDDYTKQNIYKEENI